MVVRGRVRNGVVVLDDGVLLPEGLDVTLLTTDKGTSLDMGRGRHSVLEISPISVGAVLHPLTSEDDLLGEMLGRL